MSIIHEALKKTQQDMSSENPNQPANSGYIYAASAKAEAVELPKKTEAPPARNTLTSLLAMICALAITAGSLFYLYQQFKTSIPKIQNFASQSLNKIILHKAQNAAPELKPLAQLTIPAATDGKLPAGTTTSITLNIHGIMANDGGNLVLINDQIYQPGDTVDGAKIVKIDLNSITVDINGTQETIPVKN